jgi:aspartate/methionine/tyrosine aminotransferase
VQTRSKLPDVGTTIFTVIGQLSAQHNAINLSQGAPNFSCDPKLIAGVTRAMEAGHNQYAAMTGLQPLKERIAEKIATLYGTQYDPAARCWSPPAPAKGSTRQSADWCIRVMR